MKKIQKRLETSNAISSPPLKSYNVMTLIYHKNIWVSKFYTHPSNGVIALNGPPALKF